MTVSAFLLLWLLSCVSAIPTKRVYGARGGSIVLPVKQLPEGTNVTSVVWKYYMNKASQWLERDVEPTYFGMFKTRATLDIKTWTLAISDLQPVFSGEYSAEVNRNAPCERMALRIVDAISVHGVKGQSITLRAEVSLNEHVVIPHWTHNNTIIADWDEEEQQAKSLFLNMKLDKGTFDLTISDITLNCSGIYTFNYGKVAYQLAIIDDVLHITKQCSSTECTLTCTGVYNKNTQVTWSDNKGRQEFGSVWRVERSEHLDVIYTCNCSTSSSCKAKSISEQELLSDYSGAENTKANLGVIVGIVAVLPAGIIIVAFCILQKVAKIARSQWHFQHRKNQGPQQDQDQQPEDQGYVPLNINGPQQDQQQDGQQDQQQVQNQQPNDQGSELLNINGHGQQDGTTVETS